MPRRILVVEDDADTGIVLRMLLEAEGHTVMLAQDLSEAREHCERHRPDLAVLDLILPDGNALDFCNELRAARPPVPVIVLTAWSEERLRQAALDNCANEFLSKPFDPERLEAVVRRLLADGGGNGSGEARSEAGGRREGAARAVPSVKREPAV